MSESREVTSVESRLAVLEDTEAIKRLKAQYFWCVDNKDWPGLRALLTDDMRWYAGGKLRQETAEGFVASVAGFLASTSTVHRGCMPNIEITGPTTATARWLLHDRLTQPEGALKWEGYGYYHDDYRKEPDGRWRISCSRLMYFRQASAVARRP